MHRPAVFFAALAVGLAVTAAMAGETSGAKDTIGPTVKIYRGEHCVEPTADMRRNHMKYILHQRDRTMHQGIRTSRHSLKNCVNCHADPKTESVLGPEGFCASCHAYASVKIDCFSCHTDKRDPTAAVPPLNAVVREVAP